MNFTAVRITFGIVVLAALAVWDIVQKGSEATRWKEYLFLAFCAAIATVYGMVNDQVTSRISWEYFYYGKELAPILGPQTPPNALKLSLQAMRIGAEATWWAGLIFGAAMLIANNPGRIGRQLSFKSLAKRLPMVIGITAVLAVIFGFAGANYYLNWISPDFRDLVAMDYYRPHRFMAAWGVHLGGYVGGVIATIYAVTSIVRERRSQLPLT